MNRKKVIVTGASGFIGANLVRRLAAEGHEVHCLLRRNHREWRIEDIRRAFITHTADVSDKKAVRDVVLRVRPELVFHLAAYGAYSYQNDIEEMIAVNVRGIHYLVSAALEAGVRRFVNVGSSSEYGFKDHAPKEDEPLEPNSHYALSKAYAAMFCRHTALSQQAGIVTLRPYSVYGPYEEPARFIPALLVNGLQGRLPPLASPEVARDFLYVDDFLDACLLCAQKEDIPPGAVYNAGTGIQTTLREAVETARQILSIPAEPNYGSMKGRSWDTSTWVSDSGKIKRELGWAARCGLRRGLKRTINWLRDNPAMESFYGMKLNS